MREGTGNCSLFSWALEDALLRFVTHSRYNFGTFEKRERRWFSVYATPAKAFSVFPNLLCKQGAAGSSPATSTNLFPFKKIARESVPNTTCYSSRGSRLSNRLTPINLIPALSINSSGRHGSDPRLWNCYSIGARVS